MTTKYSLPIAIIIAAVCAALWLWPRPSPWAEAIPPASPYPLLNRDSQPSVVQTSKLPLLAGYKSPKPVVAADGEGNVVVVAHGLTNDPLGSDMLVWRSVDRGISWGQPDNVTNRAMNGEFYFDPWLETDGHGHFYFVHALVSDGRPLIRILKYLQPGQRVFYTPYEGGQVRLEVVDQELVDRAASQGKTVDEWPTIKEVTNDYIVLNWNTEERTATQIVPTTTIVELWINNKTRDRSRPTDSPIGGDSNQEHQESTSAEASPPSSTEPAARGNAQSKADTAPEQTSGTTSVAVDKTYEPQSDLEKAVGKLVLVFFQDKSRRAVPCLVLNVDGTCYAVTTGPATLVPDGTAPAVDAASIEWGDDRSPVSAEYDPRSNREIFLYRTPADLTSVSLTEDLPVKAGDKLTAISLDSLGRLQSTGAKVTNVDQTRDLSLPERKFDRRYTGLIEIDRSLLEGTPLFRDGKLAGMTMLGNRFIGESEKKSYLVPASRLVASFAQLKSRDASRVEDGPPK